MTPIAFSIRVDEHAVGAVNLVLQRHLVKDRDVARRYAPLLRSLADDISRGASRAVNGVDAAQ